MKQEKQVQQNEVGVDPATKFPKVILQHAFSFLMTKDLATVQKVSKTWNAIGKKVSLWNSALTLTERKTLNHTLYQAIIKNDSRSVQHYCQIGADVNILCEGAVDIKKIWSHPVVGHFENPSLLHIATNYCSKERGVEIVKILLKYGAKVDLFCNHVTYSGFSEFLPPCEIKTSTNTLEYAFCPQVRAILIIAKFEVNWKNQQFNDSDLFKLKNLENYDNAILKAYCEKLQNAQQKFVGFTAEYNVEQIQSLKSSQKRCNIIEEFANLSIGCCNIL